MKKRPVQYITVTAMLVALCVVLDRLSAMSDFFKIGLGFVPVVIAAALYGPATSALVYGLSDFIAANLFPKGAYFPGFTLSCILMGAVYGIFLYKKSGKINVITAEAKLSRKILLYLYKVVTPTLINTAIGMFLTTFWISLLYDEKSYWGYFMGRIPQHVILTLLNLVLIPALVALCARLEKFVLKREKQ